MFFHVTIQAVTNTVSAIEKKLDKDSELHRKVDWIKKMIIERKIYKLCLIPYLFVI